MNKQLTGGLITRSDDTKTQIYISSLRAIPLFSEFSEDGLILLLANGRVKHYEKNHILNRIGDKGDYFNIIIDGSVKIFRETRNGDEIVLSILGKGNTFGKTALLKNSRYTFSIMSLTETTILRLPKTFLFEMAENHTLYDDFLTKLLEATLDEVNQRSLEIEHLTKMTSAQRVACFLLSLCNEQQNDGVTFQLPYEKSLIAKKLGMTPETFSRSLKRLSTLGVETKNSHITIQSLEHLKESVCGHCSISSSECTPPFAVNVKIEKLS